MAERPVVLATFPIVCQASFDIFLIIELDTLPIEYTDGSLALKEGCQSINDYSKDQW